MPSNLTVPAGAQEAVGKSHLMCTKRQRHGECVPLRLVEFEVGHAPDCRPMAVLCRTLDYKIAVQWRTPYMVSTHRLICYQKCANHLIASQRFARNNESSLGA